MSAPCTFRQLYNLLEDAVDPGTWWPAETNFEIGVGAILTQNTAWVNVEQAIAALEQTHQLSPTGIAHVDLEELKDLIRPAGFMNAKATYLKNYATWYLANHATAHLVETTVLRSNLLEVKGIGPETADDILLYMYDRPVFIWDTYARRMLATAGYQLPQGYEATRRALSPHMVEAEFSTIEQQRFHGLIVEAGKQATAAGGWEKYWDHLRSQSSRS